MTPASQRPWRDEVRQFADTLLDVSSAGTAVTARHRSERARGMVKLWTSSLTIAPIAGTRGAAYNAVTEYFDRVVPVRGGRTTGDASTARALRSITAAYSAQSLQAKASAFCRPGNRPPPARPAPPR